MPRNREQVLEEKIQASRDASLNTLRPVGPGDTVRIQLFYMSFEPVLEAILEASSRTGVQVRLLLDANKDSFNRQKG